MASWNGGRSTIDSAGNLRKTLPWHCSPVGIYHSDRWLRRGGGTHTAVREMIRKMALTQAESGILHVDDHHRHQYHHDEVYDVEHHSWPVSYDILRHKIERYKLRAEVASQREGEGENARVAHERDTENRGLARCVAGAMLGAENGELLKMRRLKCSPWNYRKSFIIHGGGPCIRLCLLRNSIQNETFLLRGSVI